MNNITIQCISLPDSDRREKFSNRLEIPFSFFDAVDGRKFKQHSNIHDHIIFDYNGRHFKYTKTKFRSVSNGELGCTLSHYLLWEKLLQDDKHAYLIMEDDSILLNKEALNHLPDYNSFDICYLYGYNYPLLQNINQYYYRVPNTHNSFCGTYGYVVTKSGAKKLYDNFELYCNADGFLHRSINNLKLNVCGSHNPIIKHDFDLLSDLDNKVDKNCHGLNRQERPK
jgi:GR25 family glycosyltransferase involved in LPS biosynthesis